MRESIPSPQQIKFAFASRIKKGKENIEMMTAETAGEEIPFIQVFDKFVKECGTQNNWTTSTYEKFAAVKKHLIDFNTNLSFDMLDEATLNEYIKFLREESRRKKSGALNAAIIQTGRKIIVDAELALKLAGKKTK